MQLNVNKEISTLQRLCTAELRRKYAELFGETPQANNKPWLIKRIA
jgi:hypothetical protein